MAMAMGAPSLIMLVLLVVAPTVYGVDHIVGGDSGWSPSGDYVAWAAGEIFTVRDNLVFKYDSTQAVAIVSESGYKSCNSSNALKTYNGGNSKVPLSLPGNMYFISPTPSYCSRGMKLAINVVGDASDTRRGSSPPTTLSVTPPNKVPATLRLSPPSPIVENGAN
ncbi:basic blue protein-like [Senna tora]|uniref:Basic blue protein-like n=1 Tax=Senna tora TaxID=362788 RepID=A0A834T402_9FABA|nr:basic blue protein-like [Senna tora]